MNERANTDAAIKDAMSEAFATDEELQKFIDLSAEVERLNDRLRERGFVMMFRVTKLQ